MSLFSFLRSRERTKDVFYFWKNYLCNNPKALTDQKCSKLKTHHFSTGRGTF